MFVKPGFKHVPREAGVVVNRAVIVSPDTCPVNYTGCSAFSRDRAGSFPICCAVAPGLNVVLVGAEHVCIVLVNTILEVGHTSVTYFDGVLVEYLIE